MAAKKKATKKSAIARRKRPSAGVTKVVTTVETEQKGVMSRQDIADIVRDEMLEDVEKELRKAERERKSRANARTKAWNEIKILVDEEIAKPIGKKMYNDAFRALGMAAHYKVIDVSLVWNHHHANTREAMACAFWVSVSLGQNSTAKRLRVRMADGSYHVMSELETRRFHNNPNVSFPLAPERVPEKILAAVDAYQELRVAEQEQNDVCMRLREEREQTAHATRSLRTRVMREELKGTDEGQAILLNIDSMKERIRGKVRLSLTDGEE